MQNQVQKGKAPKEVKRVPKMENKIKDPRYKDTHVKMEHNHRTPDGTNITVHYWKNKSTGDTFGFKFKNPK